MQAKEINVTHMHCRRCVLFLIFFPIFAFATCSTGYRGIFINEINTKSNFVELYTVNSSTSGNYSLKVCTASNCLSQSYVFNGSTSWYTKEFSNLNNQDDFDATLYDTSGNVVDYIRVGNSPIQTFNTDYVGCPNISSNIATSSHTFIRTNNGQRDFYRSPDGSSLWMDTSHNNDTKDAANNGTLILPVCYTDNFDRSTLGSIWSIIKNTGYTPKINSNKLMLTDNSGNRATGVTVSGDFPSANNILEIEFEHNAYGGSGADGLVVVFSDANITPIAGSYGGSLGYAQRGTGYEGFAGGWFGFGLDEYGNFSNPTEGRIGGPGFRADAFAVRGRGIKNASGQWNNGYAYIAGTNTLTPGIDNTASSTPSPGHHYKFTIDSRNNQTWVKVERKVTSIGIYATIIDSNATQGIVSPSNFKLSFTSATGGSTNYHSLDNLIVRASNCGTLGKEPNPENAKFDAWNTDTDHTNRFISTKIVQQAFNLTVGSLNDNFSGTQEYNGTVCAQIVDENNATLVAWQKLLFAKELTKVATFNTQKASKKARVALAWKNNANVNCPIVSETNSTLASDDFAIRPNAFDMTLIAPFYAGENFKIDFDASSTTDYNETLNSSFMIEQNISKSSCVKGDFNITNFSFVNGQKLNVDANLSEVGDFNLTLKEIVNSEFALVDKKDTPDTQRFISPKTKTITVQPYELNITDANFTASTGKSWLYDANVSEMYVNARATVQANNKQHVILQNFTSTCYAKPVDLTFYYDTNNTNSDVNLSYVMTNGTMLTPSKSISDINKTITLPASLFTTASASADYRFNVDRVYNRLLSPIDIALKNVKVTSTSVAKDENNATINQSKRFYYGRIKTKDIATDKTVAPHLLHVEVYSPTPLNSFYQNSLNWYINGDDDGTTVLMDGNFSENKGFINTQPSASVAISGTGIFSEGVLKFNINNLAEEQSSIVHVGIPSWLWNSNLGDYNNSVGSTCANHPCFTYKYTKDKDIIGIKSGVFKGSTIGSDYNASYQKSGVKTFR